MTMRMHDNVLEWLREAAAKETIKRKRHVSMNTLAVDVLTEAMEADKKSREVE